MFASETIFWHNSGRMEVMLMPKISGSPKTASVNIRLRPDVKAEAERVFEYHGLSLAEAVGVFISHACRVGGFPFELRGANYTDPESLEALREAIDLMNDPNAKRYTNVAQMLSECLDGEDDDD